MNQDIEDNRRELPAIDIAGVEFYVDAVRQLLIDTANVENTISTLDMMMLDDHMELLFDKETRNIKEGNWTERDDERYDYVWLRPLEVYDTEGAEILLGHEGQLIPKDMPVIDVEGVPFLWDKSTSRLLQQDIPWNQVSKSDMQQHDDGVGFYFDTQIGRASCRERVCQ